MELPEAGVGEAARLLGEREATVRRWVRQGLLPPGLLTESHRRELIRWARSRGIEVVERAPAAPAAPDLLADAVDRGRVLKDVRAASAAEVIEAAVGAFEELTEPQRRDLLARVLERERQASTALGRGVAVPHPRRPEGELFPEARVQTLFLAEPVDWAAPDGGKVGVVFLLVSPNVAVHLEILSRLGIVLRRPDFHDVVAERPTREELTRWLRTIRKGE